MIARDRFLAVVMLVVSATACDSGVPASPAPEPAERRPLHYRNPMDPSITSAVPRKDHMGMDYIPIYADAAPAGIVELSAAMINSLGVRTAAVRRGKFAAGLHIAGVTAFDERGRVEVRVRVEGYVERLSVRAPGEAVRRGQLLFEVFSPRLAAAQREFVAVLAMNDTALAAASAMRLRSFGLDAATIDNLRSGAAPLDRVAYRAPVDGVVIELGLREGGIAEPGMSAMTLAPIDRLWVIAEVPEAQSALVKPGMAASLSFAALPGQRFEAEVLELLPSLEAATRTRRARIRLVNPGGQLAAGMIADVMLAGSSGGDVLLVPLEALIRTGGAERVIIALDGGRYLARPVVSGRESGEEIEIRDGLAEGERVVVSGQFMIDSESQMRSGLARFEDTADAPQ